MDEQVLHYEGKESPQIEIEKIIVLPGRGRKDFGDLMGLSESIKKYGVVSPVAIKQGTGEYVGKGILLAGERRLRAATIAGLKTIPYRWYNELTPQEQYEIELEENIQRKDMHWTEQCAVRERIYEAMKARGVSTNPNDPNAPKREATLIDVAAKTGEDVGHISKSIKLSKKLRENPELLAKFAHLPMNAAIRAIDQHEEVQRVNRLNESGQLKFSSSVQVGDSRTLVQQLPDASIDCIITDPPFGIEELSDNEGKVRGESQSYLGILKPNDNLNLEGVRTLISDLAPSIERVLKPGAYFYIFHAADIYELLKTELTKAGLYVAPKPIIWNKLRPTTGFTGYNYPSSYEPILFGYKPPVSRRLAAGLRDIIDCPPVPVKERFHPFEKPRDLIRKLIENSTVMGQKVLDLFCGSGAVVATAELCGREGIGFELDPEHFVKAQMQLMKAKEIKSKV
jgi:ParB-like chromosome segregation protein Spo0J